MKICLLALVSWLYIAPAYSQANTAREAMLGLEPVLPRIIQLAVDNKLGTLSNNYAIKSHMVNNLGVEYYYSTVFVANAVETRILFTTEAGKPSYTWSSILVLENDVANLVSGTARLTFDSLDKYLSKKYPGLIRASNRDSLSARPTQRTIYTSLKDAGKYVIRLEMWSNTYMRRNFIRLCVRSDA
jgi:hypothetical protein